MKCMVHKAAPTPCDACAAPASLLYKTIKDGLWVCEACAREFGNPCFVRPRERTPEAVAREADRAWKEWSQ